MDFEQEDLKELRAKIREEISDEELHHIRTVLRMGKFFCIISLVLFLSWIVSPIIPSLIF